MSKSKMGPRRMITIVRGLVITQQSMHKKIQSTRHTTPHTHTTAGRNTGQRRSAADKPTSIAMVSSSLMSSRAPISAHVTLGTVTKPSLLAEGWTEDRATMKSFNSMHSPCSCSSERGSWFLSNLSRLCNSSWTGAIERKEEHKVCWNVTSLYF